MLASGTPEAGLTEATFTSQVTFTETSSEGRARTVRSGTLAAALSGQTVSRAPFRGGVTFEEDGLGAAAADATYDPEAGTLALDGPDAQGPPRLEDARVSVSGDHIDVALDTHGLTARGHVRTTLRAETDGAQAPGLLDRGQAARVSAVAFHYAGADAGTATYSGEVQLLQGDSTIRAERLVLDPESGDLDAAGSARATFALENGTLVGRADRIHYDGAGRVLEYGPLPRATAKPAVAEPAQLNGPQGDLRAERITLTITEGKQALDRMDALGQVRLTVEGRAIRGARLRYDVAAERYDVEGTAAAPVTVTQGCDATTGRTLTWYRGTDRMLVDGREDARTRTTSRSGPCPEPRTP